MASSSSDEYENRRQNRDDEDDDEEEEEQKEEEFVVGLGRRWNAVLQDHASERVERALQRTNACSTRYWRRFRTRNTCQNTYAWRRFFERAGRRATAGDAGERRRREGEVMRLENLVRDWSEEGKEEREKSHHVLVRHLRDVVFKEQLSKIDRMYEGGGANWRTRRALALVPGAGLGRLAGTYSKPDSKPKGTNFPITCCLEASFLLNCCSEKRPYEIVPYWHSPLNHLLGRISIVRHDPGRKSRGPRRERVQTWKLHGHAQEILRGIRKAGIPIALSMPSRVASSWTPRKISSTTSTPSGFA